MSFGEPVWCHKCHIRIAPYDVRTVFRNRDYHRQCFLRMKAAMRSGRRK